ncbi:aspartyl protease family protein [Shewanella avicenniae]|uniref:Aspartyl protease family protein n=1 Tax=Shewanella avicenniae TaxID=2814294 RepID=A0ABX7QU20_9GAMM|nr:pepsin/retropepsin-like aspartic protease family protein [Shewanella avicenniae]QSX34146.1 aspartyl protease family protein [Shewanella avicenniae]
MLTALMTALSLTTAAAAAVTAAPPAPVAPVAPVSMAAAAIAEQAPAAAQLRYENRGRPVIETQVNGKGPYFMVVDTGAESSLIVPALGDILGVQPMDSGLVIRGATGKMQAKMYPIDEFSSAIFHEQQIGLLELPNPGSTPAAGIVGMDLFADKALVFDIANGQLRTETSGAVKGHYATVKAIDNQSLLISVMVSLNGVEIPALIDTGAAATIGNYAAMQALGWQTDSPELQDDGAIRGSTAHTSAIKKAAISTFAFGPLKMRDVPVRFTTQDDGQAARITLGSDLLNNFIGFALDFPKRELLIMLPDAPGIAAQ